MEWETKHFAATLLTDNNLYTSYWNFRADWATETGKKQETVTVVIFHTGQVWTNCDQPECPDFFYEPRFYINMSFFCSVGTFLPFSAF